MNSIAIHPETLLQYMRYRHQILLDSSEIMSEVMDGVIHETLLKLHKNEYYYHLEYHQKIMINFLYFNDYSYLKEYLKWRYRLYSSRGIDLTFFHHENKTILRIILQYVKGVHGLELSKVYDYLNHCHEEMIKQISNQNTQLKSPLVESLYQFALTNDKDMFEELFKSNTSTLEQFCEFFTRYVSKVIVHIGAQWEVNAITIAQEHVASRVIKEVVLGALDKYTPSQRKNEKIFISCARDEQHSLGIEIASKILYLLGYEVVKLSNKTTHQELINAVYEFKPEYMLFTATLPTSLHNIAQIIKKLHQSDLQRVPQYCIAGNAVKTLSNPYEALNCDYYFEDFVEFFQNFSDKTNDSVALE